MYNEMNEFVTYHQLLATTNYYPYLTTNYLLLLPLLRMKSAKITSHCSDTSVTYFE